MGNLKEIIEEVKQKQTLYQPFQTDLKILQESKYQGKQVESLTHCIYDLTKEQIEWVKENKQPYTEQKGKLGKLKVGTLRPEQTLGVAYLTIAKSCLFMDSVGLGKTVQAAGYLNILAHQHQQGGKDYPFRAIMYTEIKAQQQVIDELIRFTNRYVEKVTGEEVAIRKWLKDTNFATQGGLIVASHTAVNSPIFYGYLKGITTQNGMYKVNKFKINTMIIDEGSVIGYDRSQITQNFYEYRKLTDFGVVLNATPFERQLLVLYNQLYFVDERLLPKRSYFQQYFCEFDYFSKRVNDLKYKHVQEFEELTKHMVFGQTRKGLGATIENSRVELHLMELSKVQKAMMKKTQLYGLVSDIPTQLDEDVPFNEETTPKLQKVLEIVDGMKEDLAQGEQVLIYSHYKMNHEYMKQLLEQRGYKVETLNGETKKKDADKIINDFKTKQYSILITNVQKSLNFGACNTIIFYTFGTNPSKMIQIEGRTTREFNVKGKTFHVLCMKGYEYKNLVNKASKILVDSEKFIELDDSLISRFLRDLAIKEKGN